MVRPTPRSIWKLHGERATLAAIVALVMAAAAAAADQVERVYVYEHGKEGYHTFRIPAVIQAPSGDLLAFCEGRKDASGDHGNLDMMVKRSTDGGRTWGPAELVYEEGGAAQITIGNPCPVVDESNGRIWLPFCRDNTDVLMTYSDDDGRTWSKPRDITADVKLHDWGWYATGPGIGIQLASGLHKGRLVIPCDHRTLPADRDPTVPVYRLRNGTLGSHVIYSDDHGQTWMLSAPIQPGANECQVVELADGALLLNARMQDDRTTGERGVATSRDGGATWSALSQESDLNDPICQASLIRYRAADESAGETTLLFSNPSVPTTLTKGERKNLTVRKSTDGGKTWRVARSLHPGPAAYSCLIQLADGSVGCLYEGRTDDKRSGILFARFPLDWLDAGEKAPATDEQSSVAPTGAQPVKASNWLGIWEAAAPGHGGELKCAARRVADTRWEATFSGYCNRQFVYEVKMQGEEQGDEIVFSGDADLGEGEGVYHWTGKIAAGAFTGEYTSDKGKRGSFKMEAEAEVNDE